MNEPVTVLKNVGEKRAAVLGKLGICTVKDLLSYYPKDYEDRTKITPIRDIVIEETNIIKARVVSSGETARRGNITVTKITLEDETGRVTAVWYNQPYMKNNFIKHREYIFAGKTAYKYGETQIMPYDYENTGGDAECKIIPRYPLAAGISAKIFRSLVYQALKLKADGIRETLPEHIMSVYGLCPKREAVINIHFPKSNESFYRARRRLVFEELFAAQLTLLKTKNFVRNKKGVSFGDTNLSCFIKTLPFMLTPGQKNALNEITRDLNSEFIMNRLLQGDVGCGKTAVAAAACYICIKNGYQASVMAPTEILAKQHFEYFSGVFGPLGIETVCLTSSVGKREKAQTLEKISRGEADMIVGTHAVIQEGAEFKRLGIAVTDEQHRFGVRQRRVFAEKGISANILVMTATPIPRSLALILYGDLDISVIEDKPPGRQSIDTFAVSTKYRRRVFDFVKNEIEKGRQAYFICPAIDPSENFESVASYEAQLSKHLAGIRTASLHGKMKQADKDSVMEGFKAGHIKAVVSTTVIEVGVNVPNASVMVVEGADRFGLSQLHQLRGRVGRGNDKSYCVLVTDSVSKVTKQRMEAMTKTQSGFELSRLDLEIRGPGDFFGVRQHGLIEMKIANLYSDADILRDVQKALSEMPADEMADMLDMLEAKYTDMITL